MTDKAQLIKESLREASEAMNKAVVERALGNVEKAREYERQFEAAYGSAMELKYNVQ